jgi:flagellar basal-body rod modification protein FlgD
MEVAAAQRGNRSATQLGNGTAGGSATALADFEQFLNLFVAQLKTQDPLSPMESEEFLAQTAQFSRVEQLVSLNKNVEVVAAASGSSNWATAAALVGRNVLAGVLDEDGVLHEISGRVVEVNPGTGESLLLGLEDGTSVPLANVLSLSET